MIYKIFLTGYVYKNCNILKIQKGLAYAGEKIKINFTIYLMQKSHTGKRNKKGTA